MVVRCLGGRAQHGVEGASDVSVAIVRRVLVERAASAQRL
jgi:hypothetical protein